jgi:hypothetical protein
LTRKIRLEYWLSHRISCLVQFFVARIGQAHSPVTAIQETRQQPFGPVLVIEAGGLVFRREDSPGQYRFALEQTLPFEPSADIS